MSKEKDPKDDKDTKKDSNKVKQDSKKAKKDSKKAQKVSKTVKKVSKTAKKNTVSKTKKENVVDVPPVKNPRKLKFAEKKGAEESDSSITNPWGDISYVDEIPVDPPEIRTFPPTFTEPYVAPLHHQVCFRYINLLLSSVQHFFALYEKLIICIRHVIAIKCRVVKKLLNT